jgi:hypothetical protein
MAREKYRVSPAGKGWEVKEDGSSRREIFRKKVDAVRKARQLAKASELGQLIIYKRKGGIQTEHTYRKDPRRRKA